MNIIIKLSEPTLKDVIIEVDKDIRLEVIKSQERIRKELIEKEAT